MFFVNSDLREETKQKNLQEVIDDASVKVAYGVLSLRNYYSMVKRIGSSNKIYIPKVQRGLVWKIDDKASFIQNCILGKGKDKIIEPMPNIFLFCDETTKEIQLFDGLQRTASILNEFHSVDDIKNDIMIPAALFKGSRVEAEKLFRNINDKGVKLNDFEKLASQGGEFELDATKFSKTFTNKYDVFVTKALKQYTDIGLKVSQREKTTLYELLVYAISSFSNINNARKIFKVDDDYTQVYEWGFQIAYSTTTSNESKKYSKAGMLKNLLQNFASKIEFSNEGFNEDALNKYINSIITAINYTEATLRDLYARNIVSNNTEYYSKACLNSASLVGSLVILNYYENSKTNKDKMRTWYLLQLINGRSGSNTNNIIDELMSSKDDAIEDIEQTINVYVKHIAINEPTFTTSMSVLWMLFWIQKDLIMNTSLATQLEIDHIFPKSLLKKLYKDKKIKNEINNIGNLALVHKDFNRMKLKQSIVELSGDSNDIKMQKYYTIDDNKKCYSDLKDETKNFMKKLDKFNSDTTNMDKINDARNAYQALVNVRKQDINDNLS